MERGVGVIIATGKRPGPWLPPLRRALGFGDDERRYHVALQMLEALAVTRIELLTNNPGKIDAMSRGGVEVVGRQACYGKLNEHNRRYLSAKAERAGHWLNDVLERDGTHATRRDISSLK